VFVHELEWTDFKVGYCFADAERLLYKACLIGIALEGASDEWKMIRFALGESREAAGVQLLDDVAAAFGNLEGVRSGTEGHRIREVTTMKRGRAQVIEHSEEIEKVLTPSV